MNCRHAIALIFLAATGIASATTFTYDASISLDPALICRAPYSCGFPNTYFQAIDSPVFHLQPGDVLTGTFTFLNGPVTIMSDALDQYRFFVDSPSGGAPSSEVWNDLTVTPGSEGPRNIPGGGDWPDVQVGAGNSFPPPDGVPSEFSFTGVSYSVTAYGPTDIHFVSVSAFADRIQFDPATEAPEPALLPPFLIVAGGIWRRFGKSPSGQRAAAFQAADSLSRESSRLESRLAGRKARPTSAAT